MEIEEEFGDGNLVTDARHVADGLLRLIAILAVTQSEHRFVLFDEIENGINPELTEFVLDALVSAPRQVLVTTHGPMILNYLEDDVARDGVVYLYTTRAGHTRAIRFFAIPSVAEKLTGSDIDQRETNCATWREPVESTTAESTCPASTPSATGWSAFCRNRGIGLVTASSRR